MKSMFRQPLLVLWVSLCAWTSGPWMKAALAAEEVVYYSDGLALKGTLCKPKGEGPFPVVLYHHGGFGDFIGGAPRETCAALAGAGFIGFAPIRRKDLSMEGNLDDVLAAVEFAKHLPEADPQRIGMIGFSRGGLLALMAAGQGTGFKAIVLMAPAPGRGHLEAFLPSARTISAPVLLMVAENDKGQADHVAIARRIKEALEAAGREVKFLLYPPYGNDGHRMFFEVGAYWKDVEDFLKKNL